MPDQIYHAQAGFLNATITYCLIEGGLTGIVLVPGATPLPTAILDDDPLFADAAKGDYRLTQPSPAVDAGDPAFVPLLHQADLDGEPRANGRRDLGMDELYDGLALTYPMPGRAGERNRAEARGAGVGDRVFYFYAASTGTTPFGFGGCPGLTLGLANGAFLGVDVADGAGFARYEQHVLPALSGATVALQAVGFDPWDLSAGCSVSNVVTFTYP